MAEQCAQRHLAASLAADVADCSHLLNEDEAGNIAACQVERGDAVDPIMELYGWRIANHTGDGFLPEFAGVRAALTAALCQVLDAVEAHPDA